MREEVEQALFGARLFYNVFHAMGLLVLFRYESSLHVGIAKGEYWESFYTLALIGASTYYFYTCAKNPGFAELNNSRGSSESLQEAAGVTNAPILESHQRLQDIESAHSDDASEGSSARPSFADQGNNNLMTLPLVAHDTLDDRTGGGDIEMQEMHMQTFSPPVVPEDQRLVRKRARQAKRKQLESVPSGRSSSNSQSSTNPNELPRRRMCARCNILQYYRTKHCDQCERCVHKYDHHCFFIGGCVGELNHGRFWIYLLLQTTTLVKLFLIFYQGASYYSDTMQDKDSQDGSAYGAFVVFATIAIAFIAFTGLLLGYHTFLLLVNVTTWEHSRLERISYLQPYPKGFYPFNEGFVKNIQMAFCHANKLKDWQLPQIEDAIHQHRRSFNICENKYYTCCQLAMILGLLLCPFASKRDISNFQFLFFKKKNTYIYRHPPNYKMLLKIFLLLAATLTSFCSAQKLLTFALTRKAHAQQAKSFKTSHKHKTHSQTIEQYDVALHNVQLVQYTIPMVFGASEHTAFELIIDTGSSDLWVPASKTKGFYHNIKGFACQSTDCELTNQTIEISYDDGPIVGKVAFTEVGFEGVNLTIERQSFLLVTRAGEAMRQTQGILGLGPPELAANQNTQPIQNLKELGLIDAVIFSLYMSSENGDTSSRLVLGGVDTSYIQSGQSLVYTPLITHDDYIISIQNVQIGAHSLEISTALIDSGTSCMTFPAQWIDNFISWFQELGIKCRFDTEQDSPSYAMMNCYGPLQNYPQIHLSISQNLVTLNPQDYIYACVGNANSSKCYTKLERSEIDNILILGDAFMQSFYIVIDQEQWRLGVAHSINNPKIKLHISDLAEYQQLASLMATKPQLQDTDTLLRHKNSPITNVHRITLIFISLFMVVALLANFICLRLGKLSKQRYNSWQAWIALALLFSLIGLMSVINF